MVQKTGHDCLLNDRHYYSVPYRCFVRMVKLIPTGPLRQYGIIEGIYFAGPPIIQQP